ncbi:hypothetical protein FQA47_016562 [Oryzias melastigma]|uniref:Uncharacterized protein n=1 Tax=Oryzias melastigma TaxID=30732 RepID=A0A834F681_ORYME|nr:hypothetical protein FQA47_016562 [Oryzias melastigma]
MYEALPAEGGNGPKGVVVSGCSAGSVPASSPRSRCREPDAGTSGSRPVTRACWADARERLARLTVRPEITHDREDGDGPARWRGRAVETAAGVPARCVKPPEALPAERGVVGATPAGVHPQASACWRGLRRCGTRAPAACELAPMGVYEASLPRLRAPRPPPSSHNKSRRLTYDLPPEAPRRGITAEWRRRAGPLGFVRVALCWVCHHSAGFPRGALRESATLPVREDPGGGSAVSPAGAAAGISPARGHRGAAARGLLSPLPERR